MTDEQMSTFNSYLGMPVHTDIYLTETVQDWSQVRSLGRARRRALLGHPQRIRSITRANPSVYNVGGTLVMHPDTLSKLLAKMEPAR